MKSTRSTPDKRMNTDSRESRSESEKSKQPKGSNSPDCTLTTSSISSSASPITNDAQVSFSTNIAHTYRSRSKSSVNFGERKDHEGSNEYSKLFDNQQSSNLSSSLINAFQMPQVFPNLNMPSLPDYLPSVSMPSMPNISIPNLQMPSMPSLSIPSMPNLSMPSMPNINIPSISDFMSYVSFTDVMSFLTLSCYRLSTTQKRQIMEPDQSSGTRVEEKVHRYLPLDAIQF